MWKLTPQDDTFFDMMVDSVEFLPRATQYFVSLVLGDVSVEDAMSGIDKLMVDNKELTDKIIERVGNSYITPIDREDIFDLAKEIHGLGRIIHATVERYKLYRLGEANQNVRAMAVRLHTTVEQLPGLIGCLSSIRSKIEEITTSCNWIAEREMEADYYYRHGLAELFDSTADAIEIIKWREIFQHMEKAFDHCEKLADNIKGAVIKYV